MNHWTTKLGLLLTILFLSACTQIPPVELVRITPSAVTTSENPARASAYNGVSFNFSSRDSRLFQYVATLDYGVEQVDTLYSEQKLRTVYEDILNQQFISQGATISSLSPNYVSVRVIEVLAKVKQKTSSYEIGADIVLQVTAQAPHGNFVKTYRGKGSTTGPFNAGVTSIEKILNRVSDRVMTEIYNDPEVSTYMKENF